MTGFLLDYRCSDILDSCIGPIELSYEFLEIDTFWIWQWN